MDLTNHLLKTFNPVISGYLTGIFNKIIDESHYIESLKVSKVVPIFKDGDPNEPNNYRPISLVALFGKIFDKFIKRTLTSILLKNKVFSRKQFGFLIKRSTVDAFTEMLKNNQRIREKNVLAHCTLLDLSKAIDTVDHSILLDKCSKYVLRGKFEELLKSNLKDRKQFVRYNGKSSSTKTIECGVPQGAVLGPLLFLIYINEIAEITKHNNILSYADDTNIFGKYEQTEDTIDLKLISSWLESKKLTPNIKKTQLHLLRTNDLSDKKFFGMGKK